MEKPSKAVLVRVGIDQEYGHWNSPADETTGRFVYVPIPEMRPQYRDCKRSYDQLEPHLSQFALDYDVDLWRDLKFPADLKTNRMHLDPDFEYLTYGDDGNRRGSELRELNRRDLVVFYAGLRSVHPNKESLIYAIIGLFVVDEVVEVKNVPKNRWDENAHTRRSVCSETDIIVRGIEGKSGRCEKFLPIGEFRNGAYRVKKDILDAWGNLSVKDGFIQRSARPPKFLDAGKFYKWFLKQRIGLVQENNPISESKVVIVPLRRPGKKDKRSDPFYEYGSFGCTGCHKTNLMNPNKIEELNDVRLAFAQGGPDEFRLIQITPPVTFKKHKYRCELKWNPDGAVFFKYQNAPLLIDNAGKSDFTFLKKMLKKGRRYKCTPLGQFSSYFRSRRKPLEYVHAKEFIKIYSSYVESDQKGRFASDYTETMHKPPSKKDVDRKKTYEKCLQEAKIAKPCRRKCKQKPC